MTRNGRIVIAGGSGFIGTALAKVLAARGYEVVVLSRSAKRMPTGVTTSAWDGRTVGDWQSAVDSARAVVNLAGKNVNCRYTKQNLDEIDRSRVDAVTVMAQAINDCVNPPPVLVQASTTAIYGDAGERRCDEDAPLGDGIPVATATAWENAFALHATPATRRVQLRISFALGESGGALATLARLTKCFLGGTVGSGRQYMSWIHMDDLTQMVVDAIERDDLVGLYNATSPVAVTNREFMHTLRRVLRRPWAPPTPAALVHVGAFFMRTEPVLALTGRYAVPRRMLDAGFEFEHSVLEPALRSVLETS